MHGSQVVTNARYYPKFSAWAANRGLEAGCILNDGTKSSEERLGAIGDLNLVLTKGLVPPGSHMLVVAADTLIYRNFDLQSLMNKATSGPQVSVGREVALCDW